MDFIQAGENMKTLRKLDNVLRILEEAISAVTMLSMALIVFASVVCRLLNISFPAADELARYTMIWTVYIGIIVVTRKKAHVNVEFLINAFHGKAQTALKMFGSIVSFLTLIWLFYLSLGLVSQATGPLAQKAPITHIPFWFMYSSLSIGFALSAIRQVQVFFRDFLVKKPVDDISSKEVSF